jgi:chromosome segregation ATPase
MKAILVFSHEHNTFDKRKMLDNQHPNYFRESPKTVDMFIQKDFEQPVKDFFLRDIDKLLESYEPGLPKMKPDVLKQIKEIEAEREKMVQEETKKMQTNAPIMLQRPGQEPIQLSNQEVVNMIQEQQQKLTQLAQKCGEFENMITILQKQLVEKTKTIRELSQNNNIKTTVVETNKGSTSDLENMVTMLQKQLIEKTKTIRELSKQTQNGSGTGSDDLIKQNNELQKMVGMLQQQLIEKTIALRDSKEKMTRIPIQEEESRPVNRSKSDPEIIVDINMP